MGEKLAAGEPFEQRSLVAQIMSLPGQQAKVDQVTERIGQYNDLDRYASAKASDGLALSPRFALCP